METLVGFLEKKRLTLTEYLEFWTRQRGFKVVWEPNGAVAARVNHGRWLADCPFCAGAELVDPDEPVFFCLTCGMGDNHHAVMEVKFPRHRVKIEVLLSDRPRAKNRNWEPGETLKKMREENKLQGLGV